MKQLFHMKDRNLFVSMIALSLVTVLAAVTLSLAMAAYVNQAVKNTYAGIVGTVSQRYPQAEAQVVQDLRSPGPTLSTWEPRCWRNMAWAIGVQRIPALLPACWRACCRSDWR